ncbi:MAG TPA: SurA N-terminal domain-containing protein [Terriglobales bacterium]|nr:SurA N-terminal domain-containing protein [Terriglobales bacterium]
MKLDGARLSSAKALAGLLSLVLFAWGAGCHRGQSDQDVMATVNGQKILRSEVEKYFTNQTADAPQKPTGEQAASLRLDILNQLIQQQLLMQRAQKLNLVASDDEVESKLTEFKAPYTQEEFEKRLKAKNLTQNDLKDEFRRDLTIQKLFNKEVTSKINITDADIRNYYQAHKAEFNLIEPQYHIAQIWVGSQPGQVRNRKNSKAQNDTEARAKVQMLLNRLDSGDDFATLAMDYSEDPESSANGGDMGMWPESSLKQTDQATRDALTRMRAGQVSGAIPVNAGAQGKGYRIVQLIAKEPAGQRELTDPRVQQAIREQLRQRLEQLLKTAYYEVVRDQAKVENYYADDILKNPASVGK